MKSLISDLLGKTREQQSAVNFDLWFKALASVLKHISHLSPSLNFESFARHATDAICHGLSPLQPVAAHFHIDVTTSHLWLPDSTFKLDSFFRMQNRVLMSSQTRPTETTRDDLHKTICVIPYELHKNAIEIVIYHSQDAANSQGIIAPVLEGYTRAIQQALVMREDHLSTKVDWELKVEKIIGSRLATAIHQASSPFLFAKVLRGFHLQSAQDGREHLFLHHNAQQEIYRSLILRMNQDTAESSATRATAFVSSLAAQLRYFESANTQSSFNDFAQHFAQSLFSLSHLLTIQDEISFSLVEFSLKNSTCKWHNAGLPLPILFGRAADSAHLPQTVTSKPFVIGAQRDWQSHQTAILPVGAGLFFITESVLKRLSELHLSAGTFFERLRPSAHAAQLIIEAEKMLSAPDSSRVVAASVTDWDKLPYDISIVSLFNTGPKAQLDH